MIVVDANVIAYLYATSPFVPEAGALLEADPDWVAPVLWRSELRNALTGLMRHCQMALEDARSIQAEAEDLMRGGEYQVDSSLVLDLVSRSRCSAYDCEYVALAKQLGVMLVTADQRILQAFPDVAVPLSPE